MSITAVRTLPLRVTPVAGEALDSWLEAVAARHEVVLRDIMHWCAMAPRGSASWLYSVTESERQRIATATGESVNIVAGMTPNRRDHRTAAGPASLGELRSSPWGWRADSRFCPRCLGDSGGRWLLSWRLNWSFACLRHHAMLVERCPWCGGYQRRRTHPSACIPNPGHCACWVNAARRVETCGSDLTQISAVDLPPTHRFLAAQRSVNALLAGQSKHFVIYGGCEPDVVSVIRDLKCLARWIAARTSIEAIEDPHMLAALLHYDRDNRDFRPSVREHALTGTALGITLAIDALGAPSVSDAVTRLESTILATGQRGFLRLHDPVRDVLTPAVRAIYDDAFRRAREQWARRPSRP